MKEILKAGRESNLPNLQSIRQVLKDLVGDIDSALEGGNVPPLKCSTQELVALALQMYQMRRKRAGIIKPELLGEAAWDIMLDLFIHRHRGVRVSVTSASIASGVPPTTALRWLAVLEENALITRSLDDSDRRRYFVDLTDAGETAVARCLEGFYQK